MPSRRRRKKDLQKIHNRIINSRNFKRLKPTHTPLNNRDQVYNCYDILDSYALQACVRMVAWKDNHTDPWEGESSGWIDVTIESVVDIGGIQLGLYNAWIGEMSIGEWIVYDEIVNDSWEVIASDWKFLAFTLNPAFALEAPYYDTVFAVSFEGYDLATGPICFKNITGVETLLSNADGDALWTNLDGWDLCTDYQILGCTTENACNYNPDATIGNDDEEECLWEDCATECTCTVWSSVLGAISCDIDIDECGVCGGDGSEYNLQYCDCEGTPISIYCDCDGNYNSDECGVCDGPGPIYECGCEDIPEGDCDCNGNIFDECSECGGNGTTCDECIETHSNYACNFPTCNLFMDCASDCTCSVDDPYDVSCTAVIDECDVCNGNGTSCEEVDCSDVVGVGFVYEVCGFSSCDSPEIRHRCTCEIAEVPISGCMCTCNFDEVPDCEGEHSSYTLTVPAQDTNGIVYGCKDHASCIIEGCTDASACNYNVDATMDDGSCLENDCAGTCGGSAENDECGVCGGDGPFQCSDGSYECNSFDCGGGGDFDFGIDLDLDFSGQGSHMYCIPIGDCQLYPAGNPRADGDALIDDTCSCNGCDTGYECCWGWGQPGETGFSNPNPDVVDECNVCGGDGSSCAPGECTDGVDVNCDQDFYDSWGACGLKNCCLIGDADSCDNVPACRWITSYQHCRGKNYDSATGLGLPNYCSYSGYNPMDGTWPCCFHQEADDCILNCDGDTNCEAADCDCSDWDNWSDWEWVGTDCGVNCNNNEMKRRTQRFRYRECPGNCDNESDVQYQCIVDNDNCELHEWIASTDLGGGGDNNWIVPATCDAFCESQGKLCGGDCDPIEWWLPFGDMNIATAGSYSCMCEFCDGNGPWPNCQFNFNDSCSRDWTNMFEGYCTGGYCRIDCCCTD